MQDPHIPTARSTRTEGRLPTALLSLGAAVGLVTAACGMVPSPAVEVNGLSNGALLGARELERLAVVVRTEPAEALEAARLVLDGEPVTGSLSASGDGHLRWAPSTLPDGAHTLQVHVPGRFPLRDGSESVSFTVDATAPRLQLEETPDVATAGSDVEVSGAVEPGARITVDGDEVPVSAGAFRTTLVARPGPVQVVAVDAAGNRTTQQVELAVVPSRVRAATVRSVHVSFYGWAVPTLREPVLQMAREGRISSVQLDLKDESGTVGYDSQVPVAREIGAVDPIYDLAAAVEELHELGVHVVGRIVAFRDPVLASAAWAAGRHEQVIQNADGSQYKGYGGFTNPADPQVRQYNIDLAVEAAQLGVDDILWDYVRRPDGRLSSMVLPGLEGTPEQAVVDFVAQADPLLARYGVEHGASVYGIAATRPTEIAQDIPAMARHLDYVAPMVYPSHWGPGEYGVARPDAQPYEVTRASVADFVDAVEGTGARVVPWLQDFSLASTYGETQVRAQIEGARDAGADEWLMWDPAVTYTSSAFDPFTTATR